MRTKRWAEDSWWYWRGCVRSLWLQSEAARAEHSAEAIALVKAQKVYRWFLAHGPAPPPLQTDVARRQDVEPRPTGSLSLGATPTAVAGEGEVECNGEVETAVAEVAQRGADEMDDVSLMDDKEETAVEEKEAAAKEKVDTVGEGGGGKGKSKKSKKKSKRAVEEKAAVETSSVQAAAAEAEGAVMAAAAGEEEEAAAAGEEEEAAAAGDEEEAAAAGYDAEVELEARALAAARRAYALALPVCLTGKARMTLQSGVNTTFYGANVIPVVGGVVRPGSS